MEISIFAEEAGTTREETDISFKQFYEGGFLSIASLADKLDEYGNVHLNILSEEFGIVRGEENVDEYISRSQKERQDNEETLSAILESVGNSEVMVILLSASRFDSLVVGNWESIIDQAKPGSIWCLGAARSSLAALDFDPLRQMDCEIITYERVGVARISNDTQAELLEQVEQRKPT